jgi:hypothetical protein
LAVEEQAVLAMVGKLLAVTQASIVLSSLHKADTLVAEKVVLVDRVLLCLTLALLTLLMQQLQWHGQA